MAQRQTGTVKWFNAARGFGFITPDGVDGEDLFVHQTAIESVGFRALSDGETVEFDVEREEDGQTKAVNVTRPGGLTAQRQTGTVKWFNAARGFGFITPDGVDGEDLFVHQTAIKSVGFRALSDGETVEFGVVRGEDGQTKAVNVTLPGGLTVSYSGGFRRYLAGGRGRGGRGYGYRGGYVGGGGSGRGDGGYGYRGGYGGGGNGRGDGDYGYRDGYDGGGNGRGDGGYEYRGGYGGGAYGRGWRGGGHGGRMNSGGGGEYGGGASDDGRGACYICGRNGHLARDCYHGGGGGGRDRGRYGGSYGSRW